MQPTCKQINFDVQNVFLFARPAPSCDGNGCISCEGSARLLRFTTPRRVIFKAICFFREPTRLLIKSDNLMAGFFCNPIDSASDSGDQNALKLCAKPEFIRCHGAPTSHICASSRQMNRSGRATGGEQARRLARRKETPPPRSPTPTPSEIKTFIKNSTSGTGLEHTTSVSI